MTLDYKYTPFNPINGPDKVIGYWNPLSASWSPQTLSTPFEAKLEKEKAEYLIGAELQDIQKRLAQVEHQNRVLSVALKLTGWLNQLMGGYGVGSSTGSTKITFNADGYTVDETLLADVIETLGFAFAFKKTINDAYEVRPKTGAGQYANKLVGAKPAPPPQKLTMLEVIQLASDELAGYFEDIKIDTVPLETIKGPNFTVPQNTVLKLVVETAVAKYTAKYRKAPKVKLEENCYPYRKYTSTKLGYVFSIIKENIDG